MGVLLGIDYGDVRVGLAVSDGEKKLARRLLTLQNNSNLIVEIRKIIEKFSVEKIIVGLPLSFNGETQQTKKVIAFIEEVEKEFNIPVLRFNEIMTSKMAQENLIESGQKNIKEILDQEAARIILQDYLDNN